MGVKLSAGLDPKVKLDALIDISMPEGTLGLLEACREAGIPLVVGSQFPLSYDASVLMVQILYTGLLNGGDPRRLLNDLRRQLKSRVPSTHDWASIVAYASLPDNLKSQLSGLRIDQTKRSIEAALDHADSLTKRLSKHPRSRTGTGSGIVEAPVVNTIQALREPQARLNAARER